MCAQRYVKSLNTGLARISATLEAAFDMSAGEAFTNRVLKLDEDGKRVIGEYQSFLVLCGAV